MSLVPMSVLLLHSAGERYRGRVMGVRTLAIYGVPPGLLVAGALIERIGFPATVSLYCLVGAVLTALIALRWRDDLWPASAPANFGRPAPNPFARAGSRRPGDGCSAARSSGVATPSATARRRMSPMIHSASVREPCARSWCIEALLTLPCSVSIAAICSRRRRAAGTGSRRDGLVLSEQIEH